MTSLNNHELHEFHILQHNIKKNYKKTFHTNLENKATYPNKSSKIERDILRYLNKLNVSYKWEDDLVFIKINKIYIFFKNKT